MTESVNLKVDLYDPLKRPSRPSFDGPLLEEKNGRRNGHGTRSTGAVEPSRRQRAAALTLSTTSSKSMLPNIRHGPPGPIRRLPAELLVEIFDLCWHLFTPSFEDITFGSGHGDDHYSSVETELARLAHAPLLDLSKVCSQWHKLALGTPSLWSEIQLDTMVWNIQAETLLGLLKSALERGGDSSLSIMITEPVVYLPSFDAALVLLARHSHRWQTAGFCCSFPLFHGSSDVKNRLPRLEILDLQVWTDEAKPWEAFEVVRSLKSLTFRGDLTTISKIPLDQLVVFKSLEMTTEDLSPVFGLFEHLTSLAQFHMELSLQDLMYEQSETLVLDLPPSTVNLSGLSIKFIEDFHGPHSKQVLGNIIERLTLPGLLHLKLESQRYPYFLVSWPHQEFLRFCSRSSFCTHLQSLEIYDVDITEDQLLTCLAALPSLKHLAMSDQELPSGGQQLVITDTFFTSLTITDDFVPHLRSFDIQSLLQFDDDAYLAFICSRLKEGVRFNSHIFWLPGCYRQLDETVVTRLYEFQVAKKLTFQFSEAKMEWV
ncbi:hypothetical protein DFH07DRAFT_980846 [Mycena maculata]|uniref:F-box domain-containing protein n=1 Tax=Mycena maculata TaxID=230809 RepID=A0AAD7NVG7_9AGAR|nr:hypothetical protein DFH07DRAFT_980846 [Mycena maculata]